MIIGGNIVSQAPDRDPSQLCSRPWSFASAVRDMKSLAILECNIFEKTCCRFLFN